MSELSWNRIKHPSEVLKVGQEVEVKILEFDRKKKRISLGYRKEEDNPWFDAENLYQVGDILEVTVVRFANFGVFVNIAAWNRRTGTYFPDFESENFERSGLPQDRTEGNG